MAAIYELAAEFAKEKHEGQKHFFGADSYYDMHLVPVAGLVKRWGYGDYAQATAVLHDVLEDTDATNQEMLDRGIPQAVAYSVGRLTKIPSLTHDQYLDGVMGSPLSVISKFADSSFNLAWTILNSPDISNENFREWSMEYQGNLTVLRSRLPNPGDF